MRFCSLLRGPASEDRLDGRPGFHPLQVLPESRERWVGQDAKALEASEAGQQIGVHEGKISGERFCIWYLRSFRHELIAVTTTITTMIFVSLL